MLDLPIAFVAGDCEQNVVFIYEYSQPYSKRLGLMLDRKTRSDEMMTNVESKFEAGGPGN